jgi:hypothetical protein
MDGRELPETSDVTVSEQVSDQIDENSCLFCYNRHPAVETGS